MIFPLNLLDISLLLAIIAIVLLVTSELLSPHHRKENVLINKKKLRTAAIAFSILFLATIVIRIVGMITGFF
jgi:hypothetical protein